MAKSDFILDTFVAVQPGQPYRLIPFGEIHRGGVVRNITPEYAQKFKLPHFKPPIKMGSHDDYAPAGGFITSLEVRSDGLYAIPEMNDQGMDCAARGDYRYHSPEIIWDDGAIEDATTGEWIYGPIILGDSWLHTPALGEAAALYTFSTKEYEPMADEQTVQVPVSFFDKFLSVFKKPEEPKPEPTPQPAPQVDELTALASERDQLKAKLEAIEADKAKAAHLEAVKVEVVKEADQFGASYIELSKAEETTAMLAGMTEEQRAWVMRNFKALSKQIDESKLTQEVGNNAPPAGDKSAHEVISEYAAEHKISYVDAVKKLSVEKPEIFGGKNG